MSVQTKLSMTFAVMAAAAAAAAVLVVPSFGCSAAGGVNYTVGGAFWDVPPSENYYTNWSSNHVFKIGDSLVFDFETGRTNVVQVTKQDYESCTAYKPLKVINNGPANIPLREKGVFYYISNILDYCELGLKISIVVHDCPCATPPNPSPSSTPSSSPSSPPPASPSSSPHVSSPPSPGSPGGYQPPHVQGASPAPAPSPVSINGSPEAPSDLSAAPLLHRGIFGVGYGRVFLGWGSQLVLLLVFG